MKIGILGSGTVAQALASGFLQHGHSVILGTREPAKLAAWHAAHPAAQLGSVADAAGAGELLVLAVKASAALAVVKAAGSALAGKTVIDANNPIADAPPQDGVLRFTTGPNESLMEQLQAAAPAARFVKAFNSVGAGQMIDPQVLGGPPTMFIAGDHEGAKAQVQALLKQVGWDSADMGSAVAARAIEPLAMLWCIPGLRANQWRHAFRLLPGA